MASVVPAAGNAPIAHSTDRKAAADRIQQELRQSLKQNQSLPELLTSAPFAINFLGQLKLLAFSENALRITLQQPDNGFEYLKYPSLPSAMHQIVEQASDSFHCASKNMHAIDQSATSLFGQNSHASDILLCLQDTKLAKSRLRPAMKALRDGMNECSAKAKEIEKEFDVLLATAKELSGAMSYQMHVTKNDETKTDEKLRRNQIEDKIQQNIRVSLEGQLDKAENHLENARKRFNKSAKGGEWKALGFKTVSDLEGGLAGVINGALGIVHNAPKFAIAAVQAAGALGGAATKFASTGTLPAPAPDDNEQPQASTSQQANPAPIGQASDIGIDPAIAGADQIHGQLFKLYELVHRDILHMLQENEADQDLLECAGQLKASQEMLGDFKSQHTASAKGIMNQAQQTIDSILDSRELATSMSTGDLKWQQKTEKWKKDTEIACAQSLKLKVFASAQSGQGFGDTLDIPTQYSSNSLNMDFSSIMKARHQKLLVMRAVMQEAQQNLQRTNDKYLVTQNRAIELAEQIQQFEHSKATLKKILEFLGKAIDTVTDLQREIRSLTLFFSFMSNTISILGKSHTERYILSVESGITGEGVDFGISLGDVQTHMIREAVLLLRGHFTFVIESARLYQRISATHIIPCMRGASALRIGASSEEQKEAKQVLEEATKDCSNAIKVLAEKEFANIQRQIMLRCEEVEEELKGFPEPEAYEREAIKEGVKEASQQMSVNLNRPEQELDNILG